MRIARSPSILIGALSILSLVSAPLCGAQDQEQATQDITEESADAPAAPETASSPPAEGQESVAKVEGLEATMDETTALQEPVAKPAPATDAGQWLDAVRKQRQAAREIRATEIKDARESALRASPWGEDVDQEREAYREAVRNRAAMQQEAIRARRRWINPYGEYVKDMHEMRRNALQAQAQAERDYWDQVWSQQEQWMLPQAPYGWNNPWYYRGY